MQVDRLAPPDRLMGTVCSASAMPVRQTHPGGCSLTREEWNLIPAAISNSGADNRCLRHRAWHNTSFQVPWDSRADSLSIAAKELVTIILSCVAWGAVLACLPGSVQM